MSRVGAVMKNGEDAMAPFSIKPPGCSLYAARIIAPAKEKIELEIAYIRSYLSGRKVRKPHR